MSGDPKPTRWQALLPGRRTRILLVVLVLYVFSIGPCVWIDRYVVRVGSFKETVYLPLLVFYRVPVVWDLLDSYMDMWGRRHGFRDEGAAAAALKCFSGMMNHYKNKGYANLGTIYPVGNDPEVINNGKFCGLYYEVNNAGERVTLIGVSDANADYRSFEPDLSTENNIGMYVPSITTRDKIEYLEPITFQMAPKQGYWFALIPYRQEGEDLIPLDKTQAAEHYALVAFPGEYGVTGETTFIISEEGTVYAADRGETDGESVYPANPLTAGWKIPE